MIFWGPCQLGCFCGSLEGGQELGIAARSLERVRNHLLGKRSSNYCFESDGLKGSWLPSPRHLRGWHLSAGPASQGPGSFFKAKCTFRRCLISLHMEPFLSRAWISCFTSMTWSSFNLSTSIFFLIPFNLKLVLYQISTGVFLNYVYSDTVVVCIPCLHAVEILLGWVGFFWRQKSWSSALAVWQLKVLRMKIPAQSQVCSRTAIASLITGLCSLVVCSSVDQQQ